VRDPLGWSLAPVWGLRSSAGVTPMVARRFLAFTHDQGASSRQYRFDLQSVTHQLTGRELRGLFGPVERVGTAYISRNAAALPRVRLVGRPVYAANEAEAVAAVERLGAGIRNRVVVEDPDRPLAPGSDVSGTARIAHELPERIEVAVEAGTD